MNSDKQNKNAAAAAFYMQSIRLTFLLPDLAGCRQPQIQRILEHLKLHLLIMFLDQFLRLEF